LDKIDVARRQIDAAVELFFRGGDPCAIHTLAAASYDVLGDLLSKAKVRDDLLAVLRPECREEFSRLWRAPQSFFKHADRDARGVLEYETDLAEQMLFQACRRFRALGPMTPPMRALEVYYVVRHPEVLLHPVARRQAETAPRWMTHGPRDEFYAVMFSVASERSP
jgi:hypothetical protein